jgi:TolA-binding protein
VLHKSQKSLLLFIAAAFIGGCGISSFAPLSRNKQGGNVDMGLPRTIVSAMIVYRQALAQIDKLEYAPAMEKLEQAFDQFDAAGDLPHSAESMFWLGFCREKLHRDDLARQAYVTVIQRYPGSKPAEYARVRLDTMNHP